MASPARLRPFRTTAFKLSAIYLAVFTLFTAFLIGYIARNTSEILQIQMRQALDGELNVMAAQYQRGGIRRIVQLVQLRSRQPGANIYLVTDGRGSKVAGNVESVPPAVLTGSDSDGQIVPYVRLGEEESGQRGAALVRVVQLAGGFRILIGRDVSEIEDLTQLVRRSLVLTAGLMVALGLLSWAFVSRRVLKRIDSIAETSRGIIAGDLSGRLEVTGTDDEFDRLAHSLNAMLARIERLMLGLKQVSDNIAHDLKTPLTRMRTRAEAALAPGRTADDLREALQATIEDSDQLIRTFNALLMIARAEAGSSDVPFQEFDAAQVARDVYELYEPLAEEAGVKLRVDASGPLHVRASRELISQAVANLVDNAIKYADEGSTDPEVVISVAQHDGSVTLTVADNGSGIAEADRPRVTERFVRLEESRSKPGSGLGLSLVSAVAQLHGGELLLRDNKPGLAAILNMPRSAANA